MLRPALLLVAPLSVLPACSKDQPGPAGPGAPAGGGERACTEMGCENGLKLAVTKATPWLFGTYVFRLAIDGNAVECKGALPLQPCDAGPSLRCTPDAVVQIGESGCALPAAQHGFSDITVRGEPQALKLEVLLDGKPLGAADVTPSYVTSQPNGSGCEPTCRNGSSEVDIP
jgi:hypothetical protein